MEPADSSNACFPLPAEGQAWRLVLFKVNISHRLSNVTLSHEAGGLIHLVGPNGAGKSSLLACIAGLLPAQGKLILSGKPIHHWHPRALGVYRGYLGQQAYPGGNLAVFQYLMLHQPDPADNSQALAQTVAYLAQALALDDKLHRRLASLSGGEWQRVRLAAVMLQVWPTINGQAGMLLLDEPAASLDIAQRVALDRLLAELTAAGMAVLVSSHDLNHSLRHADTVWLMDSGQLVCAGPAAEVMTPERLGPVFKVAFERLTAGEHSWLHACSQNLPIMTE
ncbi:vitamin B12 transport system ATP-binding protein [Biostraticola tofi]|uniref:Vitamin B12 import ATP-binding protein BtuD n=2 Tax=Biostraticola tofi TaxID=466109 RepID=A0A4V2W5G0_9GAMM|nr:vitamin B12 ABC transporter ATP-binding protein BtuD [Biostraticola tofi]TCV99725.1 vitamin B12 transport system ATP-binding protein [Biostraticola tofi]